MAKYCWKSGGASLERASGVDNIVRDENGEMKYHFVIIDYFVKVKGGELRAADDAEELRWMPLAEAEKYDLTKTFRAFL